MSDENQSGTFSCPVMCWIIGALLGIATYLIFSGRFEMGMIVSLIAALIVVALAGMLLSRLFCQGIPEENRHPAREVHEVAASPEDVAKVDFVGAGDLAMPPSIPEVADDKPSGQAASVASAAATASKSASAAAEEKPAPKPKPKAKSPAKPKTAAKTAKKPASKPARKPVAKDGKPEMLTAARAGGADDLKQIKGVGPKLEKMLNTMGVYHFDQVAGWRSKEVKWVDENLEGFKGRVSRDEWVKQAKVLAKGGATEFSKKVAKGGVYSKNKK